ncbi:MAG: hypothetical protein AB7V13_14740, partial [Pseudorhodoplanes sp.]
MYGTFALFACSGFGRSTGAGPEAPHGVEHATIVKGNQKAYNCYGQDKADDCPRQEKVRGPGLGKDGRHGMQPLEESIENTEHFNQ